jgi:hypothetical protein
VFVSPQLPSFFVSPFGGLTFEVSPIFLEDFLPLTYCISNLQLMSPKDNSDFQVGARTAQSVQCLGYRCDNQGIVIQFLTEKEIFLFIQMPRPTVGLTKLLIQWILWEKQPRSESDPPLTSTYC